MFSAIILAGGSGERMGLGYNKVLYKIKGRTIIEYAVKPFLDDSSFTEVIVVMNREDYDLGQVLFNESKVKIIKGGETRQESVEQGLIAVHMNDYVMIHDGARPYINLKTLDLLKESVKKGPSTLFTPAKESMVSFKDHMVESYLNRSQIGMIKTPQAFKVEDLKHAYDLARLHQNQYKDDASLLMKELNQKIILVEDDETNIKLTTKNDILIMEALL